MAATQEPVPMPLGRDDTGRYGFCFTNVTNQWFVYRTRHGEQVKIPAVHVGYVVHYCEGIDSDYEPTNGHGFDSIQLLDYNRRPLAYIEVEHDWYLQELPLARYFDKIR
jgi:hypothetical protein